MKRLVSLAALTLLVIAVPLLAQSPKGWKVRADRSTSASDPDAAGAIKFVTAGSGFHATTPQAAVFWNPANTITGNYTLKGNFKLLKPSGHTNYYGLVFGGSDLEGANQNYLYFLVAQDGSWLVKRRNGDGDRERRGENAQRRRQEAGRQRRVHQCVGSSSARRQAGIRGKRHRRRQRTEDGTSREDRRHLRDPLQSPARHRSRRVVGGEAVACVRQTRPRTTSGPRRNCRGR